MNNKTGIAYIAKHKDVDIRMNSRSGAVFVAVSDYILNNGGTVYGCVLDSDMTVHHIRATDKTTRDKMCKTKYVQSDLGNTIGLIKKDLDDGKHVLFSGTGCQAAGVLSALKAMNAPLDNFFSVDIICHGAASPKLFSDYIDYLKARHNAPVEQFEFRDKALRGWDEYVESYTVKGKKHPGRTWREIYHTDLCIRPSCYNCPYCKTERETDITIGDAWGIKTVNPSFNDNRGVSIVIPHSIKGKKMVEVCSEHCNIEKVLLEQMLQPNLQRPSKAKGNRDEFWKDYYEGGIKRLVQKYGRVKTKKLIYGEVKYFIRRMLMSRKIFLP